VVLGMTPTENVTNVFVIQAMRKGAQKPKSKK
jgi:hypothetical protein